MNEEEALKAEIAKLSGAINSHRQTGSSSRGYYQAPYRGRGRGRGAYFASSDRGGRGRGRGAPIPARNRTLILNNPAKAGSDPATASSAPAPGSSTAAATASSHSDRSSSGGGTGAGSGVSTTTSHQSSASKSAGPPTSDGWIKRKTTHNMSLVSSSTFQKTEPARLAAIAATQSAKAEARAKAKQKTATQRKSTPWKSAKARGKASDASVRRGDNMGEVVIDGVVFEFDTSGTKLVKKAVQPSSETSSSAAATYAQPLSTAAAVAAASGNGSSSPGSGSIPLRTSINGQAYIRTKRGNLVSAELVAKKRARKEQQAKLQRLAAMGKQIGELQSARYASQKKSRGGNLTLGSSAPKGLCAFFNKTGQCKRGLSCPFTHDVNKISLCPRALRPQGCKLPAGTCPLSHNPTPERVPHCVHYLRSGQCRNGDDCIYTHSDRLAEGLNTKICVDFSRLGWCDRGRDCTERHTWECPDFAEKGKCDKKGCRLLHVIRAKADGGGGDVQAADRDQNDAADAAEGPSQLQDGDLFMRDDAAADEHSDDDAEGNAEAGAPFSSHKRKRPLLEPHGEWDSGGSDLSADEGVQLVTGSHAKRKRQGKAFAGQKDFISFADDEEDDDEDEVEDEEEDGADGEGDEEVVSDEDDEHGSVHSEELELEDSDLDDAESGGEGVDGGDDGEDDEMQEDDDDGEKDDEEGGEGDEEGADVEREATDQRQAGKVQYSRHRQDEAEDEDDRLVESFL